MQPYVFLSHKLTVDACPVLLYDIIYLWKSTKGGRSDLKARSLRVNVEKTKVKEILYGKKAYI